MLTALSSPPHRWQPTGTLVTNLLLEAGFPKSRSATTSGENCPVSIKYNIGSRVSSPRPEPEATLIRYVALRSQAW